MAKIIPFQGILYNAERFSGDEVAAPPYDIITPAYKEVLYNKSPYNVVRIDFGREEEGDSEGSNKYTRARDYLEGWFAEGALVRDDKPALYAYEVDYQIYGKRKRLRGILALVKIEELGKGVYPHEETHSKPKTDRLNLMKTCRANTSPIYSLYHSPERITSGILEKNHGKPYLEATDLEGAIHKLYKIKDESEIERIKGELFDKAIFIADGHHRYEVAAEYKRIMDEASDKKAGNDKEKPWDYVLMFLANMSDEGITILPTHRMVKGVPPKEEVFKRLEQDFSISKLDMNADIIAAISTGKNTFGFYLDNEEGWHILKYRGGHLENLDPALRNLDVSVLHELILKKDMGITDIAYEMNAKEAVEKVNRREFDAVFFLNPTAVGDVERVALSNLRMPPKSTYFYPKLLTGLVINRF
ncbi:MAG: DUF1015 domain-containing protein [Nitrospirae bacterium]|nr:DUF1015 domain-containing protein [Nitrospirota bacterium]